jgi:hypothetical protein
MLILAEVSSALLESAMARDFMLKQVVHYMRCKSHSVLLYLSKLQIVHPWDYRKYNEPFSDPIHSLFCMKSSQVHGLHNVVGSSTIMFPLVIAAFKQDMLASV